MSQYIPEPAAIALQEARRRRTEIAPLPTAIAPRTETEGAAVQLAVAGLSGATSPAGFKIGATAKRMQEYLGLNGPAAGFMEARNLHVSGVTVKYADFLRPGVECELAVRLGRDLPPGPCTQDQAAAAVADIIAAIEIVENRYGDLAAFGTPSLIGDQVYHAAAVLGASGGKDWRSLDVATLHGRFLIDGELRDQGVGADLLGHPLNCLAWLAGSSVVAAFGGLKAGQVVMLGSVTPPIWLTGPASVTVDFSPLPPVQLRLA